MVDGNGIGWLIDAQDARNDGDDWHLGDHPGLLGVEGGAVF